MAKKQINKSKNRLEKGITLIALVITIIVLLILAGVALTMLSGENGILKNVTRAKIHNIYSQAEEQAKLAHMALKAEVLTAQTEKVNYRAEDDAGKLANIVRKELGTSNGWEVLPKDEEAKSDIIIMIYNNSLLSKNIIEDGKPKQDGNVYFTISLKNNDVVMDIDVIDERTKLITGEYSAGDEVSFDGESFFVLKDSKAGEEVTLLTKYCLNKEGTEQKNLEQTPSGICRKFSRTKYWSSASPTYPCDVQTEDMIRRASLDGNVTTGVSNAVLTAINYGKIKGAKLGRLMTNDEANSFRKGTDKIKSILYGTWTGEDAPVDGYLRYWLGGVSALSYVYVVAGDNLALKGGHYNGTTDGPFGVRPVLIIN